ncbi:MAG TPA: thiamine pyrophosphate-dependent dehydrogenase E1 component subunit alpha [Methylomirabilota bacterium]|nr:thiamine pyrophosphate-dependent dehydrogenase E1 component subunit alpha [Methylomirabilota bacterium]
MSPARSLYETMVRMRMVEEAIVRIYPDREIRSPAHLYIGQEAVAAGTCAALTREDVVVANYRSHGWYLAKGGSLQAMMDELFGRATGCSGGWGGSMHLIDREAGFMGTSAVVCGGIPHAVGCALADRIAGRPHVSVVAFGDGAVEEGGFHESLNFASLRRLPVVFVCENNEWAAFSPLTERQPHGEIHRRAAAYAVPGVSVDGNDVGAVQRAATEAVARARRGEGPTLLECRTYRWLEHCGPGDDVTLGVRGRADVEAWKARCPIARARGAVSDGEDREVRARVAAEIDAALAAARRAPWPGPSWKPAYYET